MVKKTDNPNTFAARPYIYEIMAFSAALSEKDRDNIFILSI